MKVAFTLRNGDALQRHGQTQTTTIVTASTVGTTYRRVNACGPGRYLRQIYNNARKGEQATTTINRPSPWKPPAASFGTLPIDSAANRKDNVPPLATAITGNHTAKTHSLLRSSFKDKATIKASIKTTRSTRIIQCSQVRVIDSVGWRYLGQIPGCANRKD